jgi:putative nucleotidyltransferase with HDIG domain
MHSRVLFVEDDPLIRQSYESMAPGLNGYEVRSAGTGGEALQLMTRDSFDVIVTDLTMPGMDGVEFLGHVVRQQPDSARIIISGYADRLKLAECLFVGHRYFLKPIATGSLIRLLERLATFRSLISNQKVRRIIGGLGSLPGPPATYVKLTELLNSPYSSLNDVAAIVEQDPGITAKLLQIVNSAQFGIGRKVVSPTEAVQLVGVEVIRGLVLGIQVFSAYKNNPAKKAPSPGLWEHSLRTAVNARRIAYSRHLPLECCEQAFLAGLLHDVGKLVLVANAKEEYDAVLDLAARYRIPEIEAEKRRFGATHADIGAYLLTLWGIPDTVVKSVEHHHSLETFTGENPFPLIALHAAQHLDPLESRIDLINRKFLEKAGYDSEIETWKQLLSSD